MALITFDDKAALNVNPDIPEVNKITAQNINEIKNVVNTNYNQSQIQNIFSGEKYNYNDTIQLSSPLVSGHLYAFTCRGVSSSYNVTLMCFYTGENAIQLAYANNGGDSYEGFRYRLTVSNNNQTLTIGGSGQSQKLGSNTAILRIDKII